MSIIKLPGMIIKGEQESPMHGTLLLARQNKKDICCSRCDGKKLRKKSKITRIVRHLSVLGRKLSI